MRMLQGLLVYARAGRRGVDAEPVDLGRAVGEALADLAGPIRDREAEITVVLQPGATVLAGVADVRIVLQNLVANAVKFSDAETPRVRIKSVREDAGTWRITVEDNGPGIAPADEERIFGAFERGVAVDASGYGLGLAIARRLIERHGGEIGLDPGPDEGSRFWFSLTAGSPPPASSPPSPLPR